MARRLAVEQLAELVDIEKKTKALSKDAEGPVTTWTFSATAT